jgi:hypothetical protein
MDCLVSIAGSDCVKSAFLDDCESGHADESLIFNHEHDRIAVAIRFAHFQPAVLRAKVTHLTFNLARACGFLDDFFKRCVQPLAIFSEPGDETRSGLGWG